MTTYERIKSLCDSKGIGVTNLELLLGFSRGSIGKMKKGGTTAPERLQKIADYFGVSVGYLITGDGPETAADVPMVPPDVLLLPYVRELLEEAEKANTDDLKAVLAMLKRLNAYAGKMKG